MRENGPAFFRFFMLPVAQPDMTDHAYRYGKA